MEQLFKELESVLIANRNPIFQKMDRPSEKKSDKDLMDVFQKINLDCCPELLAFYKWKSGCDEDIQAKCL